MFTSASGTSLASRDTWGGKGEIDVGFQITVPNSGSEERNDRPEGPQTPEATFLHIFFSHWSCSQQEVVRWNLSDQEVRHPKLERRVVFFACGLFFEPKVKRRRGFQNLEIYTPDLKLVAVFPGLQDSLYWKPFGKLIEPLVFQSRITYSNLREIWYGYKSASQG